MKASTFIPLTVVAAFLYAANLYGQTPRVEFPAPSPACTLKQRVGLTDVEIVYSRPSLRGRKVFGAMIPYGEVWRTGANAATRVTFSTDVKLQGTSLSAGAYELFTIPGRDEWTIIVQKLPEKASWGAYAYKKENDTARMTAKPVATPNPIESFGIGISDLRDTSATLYLVWENTRVPLKLEVDTIGMLMPQIKPAIAANEPKTWNFYYGASSLLYDNGGDLEQALAWVDESIKLREDYPGTLLLKTRILVKLGRNTDAKAVAAKAVETGKKLEGPTSVMARQAKDIADSLK
ncbi:MAG: DUF2911 domain-containing protein [Verrucomicrobiota bacterium]